MYYAIYSPDGEILIYTIGDSPEQPWIHVCSAMAGCNYEVLKNIGYTCRPILIADAEKEVVVSKEEKRVMTLTSEAFDRFVEVCGEDNLINKTLKDAIYSYVKEIELSQSSKG